MSPKPSDFAFDVVVENDQQIDRLTSLETVLRDKAAGWIGLSRNAAAPPAPELITGATGSVDGIFLEWKPVANDLCFGYNIYRHYVNAPDTAKLIAFLPQAPSPLPSSLRYQEAVLGPTPVRYYWVSSVNQRGSESPRVSFLGASPRHISSGSSVGGALETIIVPGILRTGSDIAYPAIIAAGAIIDHLLAIVGTAPTGSSIQGKLLRDGLAWGGVFTIAAGATDAGSFAPGVQDGLQHDYTLNLTQIGATTPGYDLTVYIL